MESIAPGDLVRVATDGPLIDGIVFDLPSAAKALVAVIDRKRGPVLRSVDRRTLTPREEAGPQDQALRLLIRRSPSPSRSGGSHGVAGATPARAGHTRAAAHRSTGK